MRNIRIVLFVLLIVTLVSVLAVTCKGKKDDVIIEVSAERIDQSREEDSRKVQLTKQDTAPVVVEKKTEPEVIVIESLSTTEESKTVSTENEQKTEETEAISLSETDIDTNTHTTTSTNTDTYTGTEEKQSSEVSEHISDENIDELKQEEEVEKPTVSETTELKDNHEPEEIEIASDSEGQEEPKEVFNLPETNSYPVKPFVASEPATQLKPVEERPVEIKAEQNAEQIIEQTVSKVEAKPEKTSAVNESKADNVSDEKRSFGVQFGVGTHYSKMSFNSYEGNMITLSVPVIFNIPTGERITFSAYLQPEYIMEIENTKGKRKEMEKSFALNCGLGFGLFFNPFELKLNAGFGFINPDTEIRENPLGGIHLGIVPSVRLGKSKLWISVPCEGVFEPKDDNFKHYSVGMFLTFRTGENH